MPINYPPPTGGVTGGFPGKRKLTGINSPASPASPKSTKKPKRTFAGKDKSF